MPGASSGASATPEGGADSEDEPHVFAIKFDYRFDTRGFFDAPERKAALEAAAAQWSAVLHDDFFAVPAGVELTLKNPEDREQDAQVDNLDEEIDDVLVFVGTSEDIPGYGRGGPSADAERQRLDPQSVVLAPDERQSVPAWAARSASRASVDYFFASADDDAVPTGQFDSCPWPRTSSDTSSASARPPPSRPSSKAAPSRAKRRSPSTAKRCPWTDDLTHLADGTQSDGVEALMTPNLPRGVRQKPTSLDLAALRDIGYSLE